MIATINDAEALRNIGSNALAAYLRSRAWKQVEQIGDRATVWTAAAHENGSGEYEILLLLDSTLPEYARRISEALQTLAIAEQRSQLDIVRDITATTSDVLRVRLAHGLIENGALPLEYAVSLVQGARDLALAAACAAARPRALYSSRKPQEAINYVSGLRMGQTEAGSFVLNIQSPVPPRSQPTLFDDPSFALTDEPFERRALLTLADALVAVRRAITSAASSGDFAPFQDAVRSGVSANLCDALLVLGMDNTAEEVSLQISWSPTRPTADKTPTQFGFRRDAFPILREAAHFLRESAPVDDFALVGTVTSLHREDDSKSGQATVSAWVEHSWRKVRMNLVDQDYRKALKAHDEREFVMCIGELMKEKRTYFLRNVRDFNLLEYPADDQADREGLAVNQSDKMDPFVDLDETDPFADEHTA